MKSKMLRTVIALLLCLLSLMFFFGDRFLDGGFVLNLSWEHIIMLGIAIVSFIVSAYSTYTLHPEFLKGEKGRILPGALVALGVILLILAEPTSRAGLDTSTLWLFLVFLTAFVVYEARDFRNIRTVLDLPEKIFTFPNGISFSYPGKYEAEAGTIDGLMHTADLKDILRSKGYGIRRYSCIYDISDQYQQWKNPQKWRSETYFPYLSFSVYSSKNKPWQTISDIYLREKNLSKKPQLTTIAGKEALLHEEYIHNEWEGHKYDAEWYEQDIFNRTVTVLLGDYRVKVIATAHNPGNDKTKIDECRAIAEGIENSLKITATSASEWSFSPAASSYASVQPLMGDINKNNIHYLTLGLQHGATQDEIRAAFQRMTEKYHPDKDSSLDAQMKFHEARIAYDALIKANPL